MLDIERGIIGSEAGGFKSGKKQHDLIAFGAVAVDQPALWSTDKIRIEGNHVVIPIGKNPIELQRDKAGGNAWNVASGAHELGLKSVAIQTELASSSSDSTSFFVRQRTKRQGLALNAWVNRDPDAKNPRSLILPAGERGALSFNGKKPGPEHHVRIKHDARRIYLTSTAIPWENQWKDVLNHAQHHGVPLDLAPGSNQLANIDSPVLRAALAVSSKVFLNKKEAIDLLPITGKSAGNDTGILEAFRVFGNPDPKHFPEKNRMVFITDEANGMMAMDQNGNAFKIETFPNFTFVNPTGCGDAAAAAEEAADYYAVPFEERLRWMMANAGSVIEHIGAQEGQLTYDQMQEKLQAHRDFVAEPIVTREYRVFQAVHPQQDGHPDLLYAVG